MRLKESAVTQKTRNGYVTVFAEGGGDFKGMLRCNKTANFILECLENETSEDEIVKKMSSVYDGDPGIMAHDVKAVLEKLRSIGMLSE